MVSMKDIAAVCGVSVATVSKALNNHSDIGEETKKKIKSTAHELGYHPNLSARALKTNKSYNIGVLYKEKSGSGLTHPYFSQVLENFKSEAEQAGYDITFLSHSKMHKDRMTYLQHSIYRGMDGVVIIAVADYNDSEVVELLSSELPVVTIDYVFNGRISVNSNNIKGMEELLSYVYALGHRKIAYICGDEGMVTTNRFSSYYRFLEKNNIPIREEYIQRGKYRDLYIAGTITNKLLDLNDPPSCIIYSDDFAAVGGMNAIKSRGLKVPDDVSIVGYDGITISSQIEPKLTTYKQDTANIGKKAAQKLISLIENPKATPISQYIMDGELIKGASVADLNKSNEQHR
jgi:LacI family transcriptional regulator/LacI family purine nucleotide synthesis repressor